MSSLRRPEVWSGESEGAELAEFGAPCENCGGPATMGGLACAERKEFAPKFAGAWLSGYSSGADGGRTYRQPWRLRVYVRNGCAYQTSSITTHELAEIICQHRELLAEIDKRRSYNKE